MVVERFVGIGGPHYLVMQSQDALEIFLQLVGKRLQMFRVCSFDRWRADVAKLDFTLSHLLLACALGVGPICRRKWTLLRESGRPERHQDGKRYGHGPGRACARDDRMGDTGIPLHGTPPIHSSVAVAPV